MEVCWEIEESRIFTWKYVGNSRGPYIYMEVCEDKVEWNHRRMWTRAPKSTNVQSIINLCICLNYILYVLKWTRICYIGGPNMRKIKVLKVQIETSAKNKRNTFYCLCKYLRDNFLIKPAWCPMKHFINVFSVLHFWCFIVVIFNRNTAMNTWHGV